MCRSLALLTIAVANAAIGGGTSGMSLEMSAGGETLGCHLGLSVGAAVGVACLAEGMAFLGVGFVEGCKIAVAVAFAKSLGVGSWLIAEEQARAEDRSSAESPCDDAGGCGMMFL